MINCIKYNMYIYNYIYYNIIINNLNSLNIQLKKKIIKGLKFVLMNLEK